MTDFADILAKGGPWVRAEVIGECLLLQGDCLHVMPHLGRVDAVVTDPPYGNSNHDGDFNARLNEHRGIANKPIANDDPETMRRVVDGMLIAAVGILPSEASACCCFCGGGGGQRPSSRGWPTAWIKAGCRFSTRSSGTSATPASASGIGGSMKC